MFSNLIFQNTLLLVLMLLWCIDVCVRAGNTFDVTKYGALVDGKRDNSKAFLNAWGDACKNGGTILIPSGRTFLVNRVMFEGECRGHVVVQVDGNLKAPDGDNDADAWITFHNVNGLTIRGTGTFDGNGVAAWRKGGFAPRSIALYYVTNAKIQGVTSLNSKGFHYAVLGCKTLTFEHITIKAPASSPNTDGIHIEKSSNVHIISSNIGTGDDCVSIGQGSKNVNVTGVDCGPGHGFSIGSIGKQSSDEGVSGVHVNGGSLTSTQNGLRIKTWVPSPFLTVSDVTFLDINMKNTGNPIIIDQHYCNGDHKCGNGNSKVQINNVKFSGITGTSASQVAVLFDCSKSKPCQGITMNDINLNSNGGGQTTSKCVNAHVSYSGSQNPPPCSS